ncbi:radical SAM protein [Anaerocolumna jejuensis]|uniref:radical SAM protein n=1 Tax=Anaerocolumna jejuensis TaxID=259063 RepID=UPI003F7BAFA6
MKLSKYNHIFEHPTDAYKKVICNYRTTALAVIDPPQFEQYQNLINNSNKLIDEDLKEQLIDGGFIFEDDVDEFSIMEIDMLRWRYSTSNLTLTIAPTMNCNFRCIYCYEKDSIQNMNMDNNVQKAIINFIRERAQTVASLNITWYGGEPLMAFDVIENLTQSILEICKENNVTYNASIITNGYLLTEEVVKKFSSFGITDVQITLDGPEAIHDTRRVLSNGKGTFKKIMANLKKAVEYTNVNIRVNIDNENVESTESELFTMFEENDLVGKVRICFGYVDSINNAYEPDKCLNMENYSKKHLEFLLKNGLNIMELYPHPLDNYCGADSISAYVIGANGNLYKCWSDIGIDDKKVGNILNGEQNVLHSCKVKEYLLYSPMVDSDCKDCEILPLCKGGCPNKRLTNLARCSEHRYMIDDYFKSCIKILLEASNQ